MTVHPKTERFSPEDFTWEIFSIITVCFTKLQTHIYILQYLFIDETTLRAENDVAQKTKVTMPVPGVSLIMVLSLSVISPSANPINVFK